MTVQSPPGMPPPPPPPVAPPPGAQKKGLGPLAWVGIGCGVILVLVCIVFAAISYFVSTKVSEFQKNPSLTLVKTMVAANPDLDLVSEDDKAGTVTIHNKKSNETVTVNLEDAKNGNFKFSSNGKDSASMSFGKDGVTVNSRDANGKVSTFTAGANTTNNLPAWLPPYPGASIKGNFSANSGQQVSRTLTETTPDAADKVLAFYQDRLKANGLTVQPVATMAVGGQTSSGTVLAESADKTRSARIVVTSNNGETTALVTYEENH